MSAYYSTIYVTVFTVMTYFKEDGRFSSCQIKAASPFKKRFTVSNPLNSKKDFDATADWIYFETSHGKGAVDSVGGTD